MYIQRIAAIDVARGFTVFIMPAVHSVMIFSVASVKMGVLGHVLALLAEGPGAQLFLLLMGWSIPLSRPKSLAQILHRFVSLLGTAYVLNFLRLFLPVALKLIPLDYLRHIGIQQNDTGLLKILLMGDILQTAALSYFICSLIYKMPGFQFWSVTGCIFILALLPLIMNIDGNTGGVWMLTALIFGAPPLAYFPLFPWLIYPLMGLALGHYLQKGNGRGMSFRLCGWGLLLLGIGKVATCFEPLSWNASFYRLGTGGTLYHLGIVLVWLSFCLCVTVLISGHRFSRLLTWLSHKITAIYCVHWIVILWELPLLGYSKAGLFTSVLIIFSNTLLAFGIVHSFSVLNKKFLQVSIK